MLGFYFLEMFYTYVLYSEKLTSFYKGESGNIVDRLNRHNSGYEKATQSGVPWTLVWKGEKATKSEAKLLERKLKNLSVKRTIEFILKCKEGIPSSDELLLLQKLSELSVPDANLFRSGHPRYEKEKRSYDSNCAFLFSSFSPS